MIYRVHIGIFCFFISALLLAGCSTSLTKYDLQEYPKTIPFFEPISLTYDGKQVYLDTNLQRAYSFAVDSASYPMESCRGVAHIDASVTPDDDERVHFLLLHILEGFLSSLFRPEVLAW